MNVLPARRRQLGGLFVFACLAVLSAAAAPSGNQPPAPKSLETQLLDACENLDLSVAAALVQEGARGTARDANGQTPLMLAVARPDLVQVLLAAKPDLNLRTPDGATALYLACAADDQASAQALIGAGADPNLALASTGRTPLLAAIENGDRPLAILLTQHQADPNHGFREGTPIACAVAREQVDVVQALLLAGARPDLPNVDAAGHPLMTLVAKAATDDNEPMIDLLLAHGGRIEETDSLGGTPLLQALLHGQTPAVDFLLAKGADVNHADAKGETPLQTALYWAKPPIWQELLDHGARIDAVTKEGRSALMMVTDHPNKKAVQFLLDHGANVNLVDAKGETALTYAGNRGMAEMVDWLKEAGAQQTVLHVIPQAMPSPPLSSACRWELAMGAIYTQADGGNPNLLDGGYTLARAKHLLVEDWKIDGAQDLRERINFLLDPGEREQLQMFGRGVPLSLIPLQGEYHGFGDKLDLMRRNYGTWKDASGLAGDMCRAAHLVVLGVAAGELKPDEGWPLLQKIGTVLQAHFDSWSAMNNNFLDSREMWRGVVDPRFESCGELLANPQDPNSPWSRFPGPRRSALWLLR